MSQFWNISNSLPVLLAFLSLMFWAEAFRRLANSRTVLPSVDLPPPHWSPSAGISAIAACVVVQAVLVSSVVKSLGLTDRLLVYSIYSGAGVLAGIGMLGLGGARTGADFGLRKQTLLQEMLIGVAGALMSFIPVMLINGLVALFKLRESNHPLLSQVQSSPLQVAVMVLILAPLAEEFLYRVILQGTLVRWMRPQFAIALSSMLFAAVHYQPGRPDFLPLLPLAISLGFVYHRRQSFLTVFTMHSTFNAINLMMAYLSRNLE